MPDYEDRFKTYFRENCPFTNKEDLDEILAFIGEERERNAKEYRRAGDALGYARGKREERSRILAMVAALGRWPAEEVNAEEHNQDLDDLTQKIREATDRPIPSSAENGFREETEKEGASFSGREEESVRDFRRKLNDFFEKKFVETGGTHREFSQREVYDAINEPPTPQSREQGGECCEDCRFMGMGAKTCACHQTNQ